MKVKIKSIVHNITLNQKNEIETKGILSNDNITYYEDNISMSFNFKENVLKRRSNEYEIILDFKSKKCFYIIGINKLEMDIKINEINDSFYVDYEIDIDGKTNHIIYSINYEVI